VCANLPSLGLQTSCTVCPAGYACPAIDSDYMTPCPFGYYSTGGFANCLACPNVSFFINIKITFFINSYRSHLYILNDYYFRDTCVPCQYHNQSYVNLEHTHLEINKMYTSIYFILPILFFII
jgi:hypothetical protein